MGLRHLIQCHVGEILQKNNHIISLNLQLGGYMSCPQVCCTHGYRYGCCYNRWESIVHTPGLMIMLPCSHVNRAPIPVHDTVADSSVTWHCTVCFPPTDETAINGDVLSNTFLSLGAPNHYTPVKELLSRYYLSKKICNLSQKLSENSWVPLWIDRDYLLQIPFTCKLQGGRGLARGIFVRRHSSR